MPKATFLLTKEKCFSYGIKLQGSGEQRYWSCELSAFRIIPVSSAQQLWRPYSTINQQQQQQDLPNWEYCAQLSWEWKTQVLQIPWLDCDCKEPAPLHFSPESLNLSLTPDQYSFFYYFPVVKFQCQKIMPNSQYCNFLLFKEETYFKQVWFSFLCEELVFGRPCKRKH